MECHADGKSRKRDDDDGDDVDVLCCSIHALLGDKRFIDLTRSKTQIPQLDLQPAQRLPPFVTKFIILLLSFLIFPHICPLSPSSVASPLISVKIFLALASRHTFRFPPAPSDGENGFYIRN
jgi:hypothetical protein